ncbi:MAG TPA: ATP-binding protein [Dehalococcoidia bacterium]|nr:ATP-binding protein [Dehalococcoidia bacterium]
MKVNTALGFLLCGFALLAASGSEAGDRSYRIGQVCAVMVALLGALTLIEYTLRLNLGIDQLLIADDPNPAKTSDPGRMSPSTAVAFVFVAIAFLTLDQRLRGVWLAQYFAAISLGLAFVSILGYIYGVDGLTGITSTTGMALHTGAAFILVSGGALLARPENGIVAPLISYRSGGRQARRLLPLLIAFTVALSVLRVVAERQGLIDTAFGTSLMVVSSSLFFTLAIWISARRLNQSDEAQERVEAQLRESNETLESRVAVRTAMLNETNAKLQKLIESLERSNSELEQFAYVASHDLQEPLRMVGSYTQLIARRYKGRLDSDADEFIEFAVDGARRMQALINDLLQFSRVGTQGSELRPVPLQDALDKALQNLNVAIEESNAEILHGVLPTVLGDQVQLVQLLQNLIGNAIKFCGDRPPEIQMTAERDGDIWRLAVSDKGIGIAPEHQERIFVIFQRLHDRSLYQGTGIGLALCRRIVERHGGQLTVESEPGQGACFNFTLTAVEAARLPAENASAVA